MKTCIGCKEEKPLTEFGKDSKRVDKLNIYCKSCNNKRTREFYHDPSNKEKKINKQNEYRKNNKEKLNETHRKYRSKYPQKIKSITLGIYWPDLLPQDRLKEYERLRLLQNNLCAICGQSEIRVDKRTNIVNPLSVDHCHATGKVRGLLCNRCNTVIGQVRESKIILQKMMDYLSTGD